jgi:hypothetical protein
MGLHITPLYSWLVTANEIKQSISVITLKVPSHITLFSKNYVNIAVRNGYIADFNYSSAYSSSSTKPFIFLV